MARSIHTTKKQLTRELWFAHTDAVPQTDDATELERQDIQKILHKTNEAFRRQAVRDDAPAHVKLALKSSGLKRTVNKRKTKLTRTLQATFMIASFSSITPLIPTGNNLAAALSFYTEHMGFSIIWQGDGMAGIERDSIALNLVENDNKTWADNASFSIGVSDLDALYSEYRTLPAKVGPLETKPWGRREFHLIAPSGVCFQFYQREVAS